MKKPAILFIKGSRVFKDKGNSQIAVLKQDVYKGEKLDISQFHFLDNVVYITVPNGFCIEDGNGLLRDPITNKVLANGS